MSQVSRGLAWSSIERLLTQGLHFVFSILLARLIAPESYGLIVIVQVFISFLMLFIDSGFSNALIQKKDRSDIDFNTVFLFNLIVSVLLYIVIFACAPLIASFFENIQITKITRVLALNLIISSVSIVQRTRLNISLDFKTLSKVSAVAVILSGSIGVYLAYHGWEVWALVVQSVISQAVTTMLLLFLSKWMPRLLFSMQSFKQLFNFGSKMMFNTIITRIYLDLYNVVIGKFYSSAQLAYYNRAFTLPQLPSLAILDVINRVAYPVECEYQNDEKKLKETYFKFLRLSCFVSLPLLAMMAVLAKPLVVVLLTEKWIESVDFLKVFALNFMVHAWLFQTNNILAAKGYSGTLLKAMIIRRTMSFAVLMITVFISVKAICYGIAICSFFDLVVMLYFMEKILSISFWEQLKSLANIFVTVIVMVICLAIVVNLVNDELGQLFIGVAIGILIYICGASFFGMEEINHFKKHVFVQSNNN